MESWRFDPLCIAEDDPKVDAPSERQDKFRIKIWSKVDGTVVYDNRLGQSEDIDAAARFGFLSIAIVDGSATGTEATPFATS